MPVRLFVGNLSYEATEAELREHFGTVGPVTYCYLPTDRETGRMRGFAFVEYADDAHAHQAIERLNNQPFRGRPLAVKEAQPRESRPPGAGPGPLAGQAPARRGRPMARVPAVRRGPSAVRRARAGSVRAGAGAGSRERNFGPDAPPKGKRKPTFNRKDQQGPRAPFGPRPTTASTAPSATTKTRTRPPSFRASSTTSPPASGSGYAPDEE